MNRSIALLMIAALGGCYKINYLNAGAPSGVPKDTEMHLGLIYGLVELSEPVNVDEICPKTFRAAHTEVGVVDWLVSLITGSILTPTTVEVYCGAGGNAAYRLDLDAEGKVVSYELLAAGTSE